MAFEPISIVEDTLNFLNPKEKLENFILWDSAKLDTVKKGAEDSAIAVRFTSMGTYFDEHLKSLVMKRPNEKGMMISGGANVQNPTVSFDAFFQSYHSKDYDTYCNNMNNCKEQVKAALQNKTLITIQRHFPFTGQLDNYIIDEAHILIGEKTRTILGFRINMVEFIVYNTNYTKVKASDVNKPTYANGATL